MSKRPDYGKHLRKELREAYTAAQTLFQNETGKKVPLGDIAFMDLEAAIEMLTEIAADIAYCRRKLANILQNKLRPTNKLILLLF